MTSKEEYESRLIKENIQKAIRYVTQCIEGSHINGTIINLATRTLKGKPFSNSLLLHELIEAEEFELLGFNFCSMKLKQMTEREREIIRKAKETTYKKRRTPHLKALKEQYKYLAKIAKERGYQVSPGTAMKFSIMLPKSDLEEAVTWNPSLQPKREETRDARDFAFWLLENEPDYGRLMQDIINLRHSSGAHLYEKYRAEIKKISKSK